MGCGNPARALPPSQTHWGRTWTMKKTPGPFGQEGTRNIKIRGTILLIVSNLLTTKTGGFILSGKKSMKRIKFLLGVAGLVVTTGTVMADLYYDCMDYSSCMATMGYSGEITDTVSSEMCNQSYPDFSAKGPYIYRLGVQCRLNGKI